MGHSKFSRVGHLVKGGSFSFSRVGHLALVFHLLVAVKVYSEGYLLDRVAGRACTGSHSN